jgi:hypothetical protein
MCLFIDSFDDIIPYTSLVGGLNDKKSRIWFQRKTNSQNIIKLSLKSLGSRWKIRVSRVTVNTYLFFFALVQIWIYSTNMQDNFHAIFAFSGCNLSLPLSSSLVCGYFLIQNLVQCIVTNQTALLFHPWPNASIFSRFSFNCWAFIEYKYW